MSPATTDPYIAELHAIRERLAADYHDDLAAYSRAALAHCLALGFKPVELPEAQAARETETAAPAH